MLAERNSARSVAGNFGRYGSEINSSASNAPPTYRKYRARGIPHSICPLPATLIETPMPNGLKVPTRRTYDRCRYREYCPCGHCPYGHGTLTSTKRRRRWSPPLTPLVDQPACSTARTSGNDWYRYPVRLDPASPPPGLSTLVAGAAFVEAESQNQACFRRIFPSPVGRPAPFTGMIVTRLQENADLVADENRAVDDPRLTPTKNNRKFPAVTLHSSIAVVFYCPILDAPSLIAPLTLVYKRGEARPFVTDFIELSRKLAKGKRSD